MSTAASFHSTKHAVHAYDTRLAHMVPL